MKTSIYQIEKEYLSLVDTLLENGGELTPELETDLSLNKEQLQTKSTAYSFIIKQLESDINIIDTEIKRLNDLKKSRNKSIERLKESLSTAMIIYDIEVLETPLVKISFRNSESVEVLDLSLLDKEYTKVSEPVVSADKIKIKEAIKQGINVVGAVLIQSKNLQIK